MINRMSKSFIVMLTVFTIFSCAKDDDDKSSSRDYNFDDYDSGGSSGGSSSGGSSGGSSSGGLTLTNLRTYGSSTVSQGERIHFRLTVKNTSSFNSYSQLKGDLDGKTMHYSSGMEWEGKTTYTYKLSFLVYNIGERKFQICVRRTFNCSNTVRFTVTSSSSLLNSSGGSSLANSGLKDFIEKRELIH